MKNSILILSLTAFLFSCSEKKKEEGRTPKQYSARQINSQILISGGTISTDDKSMLCSTNETGIFNVYEYNLETGEKRALTQSTKESTFANDFVPGTSNFIFSADKGGNENQHLFLQKTDGSVKELVTGDKVASTFYGWSHDNKTMYYTSNARNESDFDLYKMDTANWQQKMLYQNDSAFEVGAISYSEKYVLLTQNVTMTATNLYLCNLETKQLKKINSDSIESVNSGLDFTHDDKSVYYLSDEGSEFLHVMKYDIETGKKEKVFEKNWDVSGFGISFNEKYRTITINEDGRDHVFLFNNNTGEEIPMPEIQNGFIRSVSFSMSENKMLITAGSSKFARDLYVYDINSKNLKQLTHLQTAEVDTADLVEAEVVRYKSFDELEIPAIYYKPQQASSSNKVPGIVLVHGGPGGQSTVNFGTSVQYLVNQGYAVIAVNNRGSSGYGKTFYNMDNCMQGNTDLKDCIWAKKYLSSLPYIDSTKIAIMGGSYGGYMVLAALCFQPDEFKCGVEYFGVSNWMRTLTSFPPYWKSFINAFYVKVGNPNTADSVRLKNYSPLLHADKITKPLYVVQGANDVRVLKIESDEIVEAVKKNNVPVEYTIFDNEGHGFQKVENRIKNDSLIVIFLNTYLKGDGAIAKAN